MNKPKWTSAQRFVDHVFRACLARGVRTRREIITAIREDRVAELLAPPAGRTSGLLEWKPSDSELKTMISRTASREDPKTGHRPIWCVPGKGRYVSVERVRSLARREENFPLVTSRQDELKDSLADLALLKAHWLDKIAHARSNVSQIEALEEFATIREM